MPPSLVAAALLLILFVPGYLFQAGVREHNSVLAAERDLYAVAQAVAISAGGLVAIFALLRLFGSLGLSEASSLQDQLLHDPSEGRGFDLTTAQEIFLICLLAFPIVLGRMFGGWKTWRDDRTRRKGKSNGGIFFRDSPIHRRIDRLATDAHHGRIYVRIVRQSQDDIIGLVDPSAAMATTSPHGQGLAITARWMPEAGSDEWRQLPGTHIGTSGIVEIQQWKENVGPRPVWLSKVPTPGVPI